MSEIYSKEEREVILRKMHAASDHFYMMATATNCHPFVEFCGLMNEYIKLCEEAHAEGTDFTQANIHAGVPLPMKPYHVAYLGEKLGCIYGPSLNEERATALLKAITGK